MRILYLSNKPIYPIVDGGCRAMAQFLKCLVAFDLPIEHVCLSTVKHPFDEKMYPEELTNSISVKHFSIDTKISIFSALKHLITRDSYNLARFQSEELNTYLEDLLTKNTYTHVILESLYLGGTIETIRKFSSAKIILRAHNVEHVLWQQFAQNTFNPVKAWYLKRLSKDLKTKEIQLLNSVDEIFAITEQDLNQFKHLSIKTKITTIPVAIESVQNDTPFKVNAAFFLGSMNWQPNKEAVEWLVTEIVPEIKKQVPTFELHLAGSFMGNLFPTNTLKGIVNHGFVADSAEFMKNHGIALLPIKSGSGVRIKMLEALSLGIPVITTKLGAQGIADASAFEIAESNQDFIDKTLHLLNSENSRIALSEKAKQFVDDTYSISTISKQISEQLH